MKGAAIPAALALASAALAAIQGTAVNRTTDKPAAGLEVRLTRMSAAGPETVGSLQADAQGRFWFPNPPEAVHYLLEAQWDGVTYSRMIAPGETQGPVELAVYDAVRRPGAARLAQRIVFLEPGGGRLAVNETWLFRNDGRLTYHDPEAGAFRFYLPEEAGGKVTVMATAPGGMPLARAAEKTRAPGFYRVAFPIKPGETRFDLSYNLPSAKAFSSRMPYPEAPVRLVVPSGVTVKGEGLEALGQDPSLRANIFELKGRKEFALEIAGSGSLAEAASEAESGPSLEQILPRLYDGLPWILAPALAALALGFVLLYRSRPASRPAGGRRRP